MLICSIVACGKVADESYDKEQGMIEKIESLKGFVREIGEEEYRLYEEIVRMTNAGELSEQQLEEKTKEYAARINAIFYIGNRLDIYEPFSWEVLQFRMEQENDKRREKLKRNEPVYGLQQFEERTFFQYELENLTSDIKNVMLGEITPEELGNGPREFYEAHQEEFKLLEGVTYETNENGNTEILTSDRMGLKSMRNIEPAFLDFINEAREGDVYTAKLPDGTKIERKIIKMEYNEMGFENHKENAIIAYVDRALFEQLVAIVAENNPVSFSDE